MIEAQTLTETSPQLLTAKLYDAALKGNVPSLLNLVGVDPLILDRCIIEMSNDFKQSPLHVAVDLGHSNFSTEILRLKPELAEDLDQSDRWSPLHIASAKGHLEIVNTLLAVNPDMCFARDKDGRNPVHVASIKGQVQVLEVLLQAKPQAGRERTNVGETVLHLCVKHGRLETLWWLVKSMGDGQLLNSKDSDGNTILHLAVPYIVFFLIFLAVLFPKVEPQMMEAPTENSPQLLTAKLYDAALKGDVPSLLNLLKEEPLILDRCIIEKSNDFKQSPLHVAANLGHSEFSKEILRLKPELAEEFDQSKRWSPLHIASAKGHLEIVNTLLAVNPEMCFARDQDGKNPIHVAAIKGQVQVLEVLLQANQQAGRERTNDGETVLHLCVKHGRLESLELLVRAMGDGQLLNSKDRDGNTILHLAVAAKQYQTIKFLLKDKRMEKNAININGLTAMDTHVQSRNDARDGGIWLTLRNAKVSTAKDLLKPKKRSRDWLDKQRSALMVVSSLIATMAFQAGINPPGGVWQDDSNGYKAGTSIMARVKEGQRENEMFDAFLVSNTIGLVSSLTVIILLISGLPCLRLFMGILMLTMWVAVTATTVTYLVSVYYLVYSEKDLLLTIKDLMTPEKHHLVQKTITYASLAWMFLLGLLILGHVLRVFAKLIRQAIRPVVQGVRRCFPKIRNRLPI